MKKIFVALIAMVLMNINVLASVNEIEAGAIYQSSDNYLLVEGKAEIGEDITLMVLPYDINIDTLSLQNAEQMAVYNMTVADKDGKYRVEMGLPKTWENGLYKVLVRQGSSVQETWFSYAMPNEAEIDKLNTATNKSDINLMALGADAQLAEQYGDAIMEYLLQNKPIGGYSEDTFLKEYTACLAICMVKNGTASAVERLAKYIGIDISADYRAYSDNVREEILRLIKKSEITGSVRDFYMECLLLARINNAETGEQLQELMTQSDILKLDYSNYNRISNNYNKLTVFETLLKTSFNSCSEVEKRFAEVATTVFNKQGSSEQSQNNSGGGGGGNGTGTETGISYAVDTSSQSTSVQEVSMAFPDIKGHWASEAITALADKGVVSGFPDGTFGPEKEVTRAEFSTMVCRARNIEESNGNTVFFDVGAFDWFAPYVKALWERGIVSGYNGGFYPANSISRQEAAVIVWNAMESAVEFSSIRFSDEDRIADYAKTAVQALAYYEVISGYNGRFRPEDNLTRAEAAIILYKVSNITGW